LKKIICVSCGRQFVLTESEIDFYKNKKLNLPKRCEECRAKRKTIENRSNKRLGVRLFERLVTNENNLTKVQNTFTYSFKNNEELKEHFIKHGRETNCNTPKKYLKTANKIIKNKKTLKRKEKEDGDIVYFNEKTGGIVFLSPKGYIRTFYLSDIDYFKRQ
jgi:pyocin large subunit-like protein